MSAARALATMTFQVGVPARVPACDLHLFFDKKRSIAEEDIDQGRVMPGGILIVDDHEIVRRGLRSLLASRPEWEICGEAGDGLEAVEKAKKLLPDVVLMDVSMPRMDGLEATRL